jgi:microcystin-dependent protein
MADKSRRGGDLPGHYASGYERELMQRMLAEVTEFPLEFRNWMKRFIVDTVNDSKSEGGSGPGGATGFNPADWVPGIIVPVANATAPSYSLACDGALVSRTTYAALFVAIQHTWKLPADTDDGATFRLPDLRDRAPYGKGTTLGIGATDGRALGSRGPTHHHALNLNTNNAGSHSHGGSVSGDGSHGHSGSTSQNGDHAHGPGAGQQMFACGQETTAALGSGGSVRYIVGGFAGVTSVDGQHGHTIDLGGGGHGHTISSDGNHLHNVTGNTTGGGGQDTPGYAGVYYVITTGAIT